MGMENYPKTITELEERFSTEEACRDYLWQLRWPDGFACPRCGHAEAWSTNRGLHMCVRCQTQISVTAGTIFQGTHKPLRLWFRAIWYVTSQKNGVSALGLQRVLGLGSYRTAWTWLHKLRIAMVRPGRDKLSGEVEVDETYIGGERPGKRGRGAENKTLVIVAVEVKDGRVGRVRLRQVPDASAASLIGFIKESVSPGSMVSTDGWLGYSPLASNGYRHNILRDTGDVGNNLTPHVHLIVSLLKRWLTGTHQGAPQPSHLDYYLDEFTFRYNRRTSRSRGLLFYRLLQQAVQVDPVTGQEIRGD